MSTSYISAEIRRKVAARANGVCEYCKLPDTIYLTSHHIDHIYSEKAGGQTLLSNLAYCCQECNRYKGANIAYYVASADLVVTVFHPRNDIWVDHFRILSNGMIDPIDLTGEATVELLRLNSPAKISERLFLLELGELTYLL